MKTNFDVYDDAKAFKSSKESSTYKYAGELPYSYSSEIKAKNRFCSIFHK